MTFTMKSGRHCNLQTGTVIKKYGVLALSFLLIFCVNIRDIKILTLPCILFDEIGYWASGAVLAGNDWSGIMSYYTSYYSYGYGLILGIIMLLTKSQTAAYQAAIITNALLICLSFWMLYCVVRKVYKEKSDTTVLLCCTGAHCFVSIVFHSQIAWSETILMFLFSASVLLLYQCIHSDNLLFPPLLAVCSVYSYMVHQRAIGLLLSMCLLYMILFWKKKISRKKFCAFLITFLICMGVHIAAKNFFIDCIWKQTDMNTFFNVVAESKVNENNYAGQIEKIRHLFSWDGFTNFLFYMLGRLFNFGLSTFGIGLEGIYILMASIANSMRRKKMDKKGILSLYIVLVYLLTLMISSLFMIFGGRLDLVIYSRYSDWIVPIIIVIGWLSIFSTTNDTVLLKRYCIYLLFFILFGNHYQKYAVQNINQPFFGSCAPSGLYFFRNGQPETWIAFFVITAIAMAVFILVMTMQKRKMLFQFLITVFASAFWILCADKALEVEFQNGCRNEVSTITEVIGEENKIYFKISNDVRQQQLMGSLQFSLKTIPIRCTDVTNPDQDGILILSVNDHEAQQVMEQAQLIYSSKYYLLYRL